MKKIYLLLILFICFFVGQKANAQDVAAPEAGKQFRIGNMNGLYFTCDPTYNEWTSFFLDSLYTVATPYTSGDGRELVTDPSQQTFTLVNPVEGDPEIWAIEAADGQYLTQHPNNPWDAILGETADQASAQVYFIDQGDGSYLIQLLTREDKYFASDNDFEGESINDSGDYYRSFMYNDKGTDNPNSLWFFESIAGTGVKDVITKNSLKVYPSIANESLTISAENGAKITVYSIAGIKVMQTELQGRLNISSLSKGVYMVTTDKGQIAKFIKR